MNEELMKGTLSGARAIMTETGWSSTAVFRDYLEFHFLKHAYRGENPRHPILLIIDGHTTHTSPDVTVWARSMGIHLFVLPAHTSHILQPLDVAVFGPFKRYYYSECAQFMKDNLGQVVTRYNVASIACKAYLKSMNPWNIVSAFRKTGIHPLDKDAVPKNKMLPCEPFRDDTPILKAKAVLAGKQAVDEYLQAKMETRPKPCCSCQCKAKAKKNKPNPSGREITSQEFIEEQEIYASQKETVSPTTKKTPAEQFSVPAVCRPSTSGLQGRNIITETDIESDISSIDDHDEADNCCVCGSYSPPNLNDKPHLKIVNWGQCDECGHWVHLSFCHEKKVLRRGDRFLCVHCS